MVADLDLLLIAVFCTADDLLPERAANARRRITDAEVITLSIAQAMLGIPSDQRFLAVAARRPAHLFPQLPERTAYHKRRLRLSGAIEALIAEFARHSPGFYDDVALVDSTPIECARSVETTRRSQLADAADYGYCASHSRFFWGFRLHAIFALDGTPRALALTSPKVDEKDVCPQLVARCEREPGQTLVLIGDKNFRGKDLEADLATLDAKIMRPAAKTNAAGARTWRRSGSASSRSSGPPRTSSRSNATAPAPSTTSAFASPCASPHSPPPSRSTIASAAPAARSPATPSNRVAQPI
jgi:Transposase DDE domain